MGGQLALQAEVLGRAHQAVAEVGPPVVVHGDPRGQRVVRADEPAGEAEAVPRRALRERGQPVRRGRRHALRAVAVVAPRQHEGLPGLRQLPHHHHVRHVPRERRPLRAELLEPGVQAPVGFRRGVREVVVPQAAGAAAATRDLRVGLRRVDVVGGFGRRRGQHSLAVHVGTAEQRPDRLVRVQHFYVRGRQRALVDAQVVQCARVAAAEAARADLERRVAGGTACEGVGEDLGLCGPGVDVQPQALGAGPSRRRRRRRDSCCPRRGRRGAGPSSWPRWPCRAPRTARP